MSDTQSSHYFKPELDHAVAIWQAGVDSVKGQTATYQALVKVTSPPWKHVLAIGKAASSMMQGALDFVAPDATALVVTKYDHTAPEVLADRRIKVIESGHPMPDQNSLDAGQAIFDFVTNIESQHSLLVLVSGGASALAELPLGEVDLARLQSLSGILLAEGYSIDQINAVRIQISRIKGGKLLRRFNGCAIRVLGLSDIPGDNADLIGSGIAAINLPVVDAFPVPQSIRTIINQASGESTERGVPTFGFDSTLVGSNSIARQAAVNHAGTYKLDVVESTEDIVGDILLLGKKLAKRIVDGPAGVYIWGGEPTVNLPENPGYGGRNQSLALALACQLKQFPGVDYVGVVAGTDGTDGPTHGAGGLIYQGMNLDGAELAIEQADAGTWLQQNECLFVTGPTGTNVMDLIVIIKQREL